MIFHCDICKQELGFDAHFTRVSHELIDCIKALVQKVEDLSNRIDDLEIKESARGNRDYH